MFSLSDLYLVLFSRIREDRAKYLYNLDPNSAHYDPKTRSMRDNPLKDQDPGTLVYAGDNFQRYSGSTTDMAQVQLFAWQASDRGSDVHLQANPTQTELLHKQFKDKKAEQQDTNKESILAKYGGEEYLDAPARELLLAQSENYVEYSRSGRVLKGQEAAKAKSKYQEDVFINNHITVWGSFWADGKWGYKCCRSFIKMSYCTGTAGIEAQKASNNILAST
jgi:pre-mRNA-processing factor SLU7